LEEYEKKEIVVGIRPEHLAIAPLGTPFGLCLHGTVSRVADLGSFADVWANVGEWRIKARLSGGRPPVCGNLIELAVDSRHIHFFEPDRGERI
jgi:multiple sugar transport system ATP-binding protein